MKEEEEDSDGSQYSGGGGLKRSLAMVNLHDEFSGITNVLTLPYLTFGVGRLLHLPSAEAVSDFGPMRNPDVTIRSQ